MRATRLIKVLMSGDTSAVSVGTRHGNNEAYLLLPGCLTYLYTRDSSTTWLEAGLLSTSFNYELTSTTLYDTLR